MDKMNGDNENEEGEMIRNKNLDENWNLAGRSKTDPGLV